MFLKELKGQNRQRGWKPGGVWWGAGMNAGGVKARILITVVTDKFHARRGRRRQRRDRKRKLQELH
jgi:hypothetical protein